MQDLPDFLWVIVGFITLACVVLTGLVMQQDQTIQTLRSRVSELEREPK